MKVWVITDGYDSPTLGVFSRREDAEAVRGLCDNPSFEELELDKLVGSVVGPIYSAVDCFRIGEPPGVGEIVEQGARDGIRPDGFTHGWVDPHWNGVSACAHGESANSQQEAVEIVRRLRDQWLTEKAGGGA